MGRAFFGRLIVPLVVSSLFIGPAVAGTVRTVDGKTYAGAVRLEAGAAVVKAADGGETRVRVADLTRADFKGAAGGPARALTPANGLYGEYFENNTFARLMHVRIDPRVDFDWGLSAPDASAPQDFAARWTGQVEPEFSETYTFYADKDDGARLWIDGKKVFDAWSPSTNEVSGTIELKAGRKYDLKLEFYDSNSIARCALAWSSPSQGKAVVPAERLFLPPLAPGGPPADRDALLGRTGLRGEYFDDPELKDLKLARHDPVVNFDWGLKSPDPRVKADFSARWTGQVRAPLGDVVTFYVFADDGCRLWVNGQPIINHWRSDGWFEQSGSIRLAAGQSYPLKLEFFDARDFARCQLMWSDSKYAQKTVVPAFRLSPPAGDPVVRLTAPGDRDVFAAGRAILLAADAAPAAGSGATVAKVEFFADGVSVGSASAPPYAISWANPSTGNHRLSATATASGGAARPGVAITSGVVRVGVEGPGGGPLHRPWDEADLGRTGLAPDARSLREGTVPTAAPATVAPAAAAVVSADVGAGAGSTFVVPGGTGDLGSNHDACRFVYQPLTGDGQIVARLAGVETNQPNAPAFAGVMLRDNLETNARVVALTYGTGGARRYLRRPNVWSQTEATEAKLDPNGGDAANAGRVAPAWVRIIRYGKRVQTYASGDGKAWETVGIETLENLPPTVYVGLASVALDPNGPPNPWANPAPPPSGAVSTARFDHAAVTPGAPPMEGTTKGVQTRQGSFIVGDVATADADTVKLTRQDEKGKPPRERTLAGREVARILFHPLSTEAAARVPAGSTGVILETGDFSEGEVHDVRYGAIHLDSVLFGRQQFDTYSAATAVVLHDLAPAARAYQVTTRDGSVFRAASISLEPGRLKLDDTAAGAFDLAEEDLVEIRR